ncbi:MAG: Thiamine-phosphate synthase [Myxococcota bacterium]|nr:Thiamine-phosphate synthase [Myxococcota bacterium]
MEKLEHHITPAPGRAGFRLYWIAETDASRHGELLETARRALPAAPPGVLAVQLRPPRDMDIRPLLALAGRWLEICDPPRIPLLINGRVDAAAALGLSGVHLPASGMTPGDARRLIRAGMIGASCHSGPDVDRALEQGADFVVLGPVYDTPSKRVYGPPLGVKAFADSARRYPGRVFALGGVDASNAREVMAAGARGIAFIRALSNASDPAAALERLAKIVLDSPSPSFAVPPE